MINRIIEDGGSSKHTSHTRHIREVWRINCWDTEIGGTPKRTLHTRPHNTPPLVDLEDLVFVTGVVEEDSGKVTRNLYPVDTRVGESDGQRVCGGSRNGTGGGRVSGRLPVNRVVVATASTRDGDLVLAEVPGLVVSQVVMKLPGSSGMTWALVRVGRRATAQSKSARVIVHFI